MNLSYENETFDIAMAFGVIGHLENGMDKALSEVNRILKPKGLLAGSFC
ncbi:MAG: methyltransferase domain-containing protein [Vulcanimicrobiota bacterium]